MTRFNIFLLLLVLASAMLVVHTHYQSRLLYTQLDRAIVEARRLELDNERLQVEKRAQATSLRVETLAREKLKMRSATPAITQYVTESVAVGTAQPPQGGQP